ncbi:TIGR04222 domain-containing membrane protein [Amycolatopsis jejuensis]|uniref:TIGR04222 domain-containing membrane protein n=1 Tax=Amycolatopsis jejuensis TaxID=330084 RepID=UPI000527455F|nr:TIGR04222 domain-containing membrane protein [Amycolatopsis jejuensis]
MEWTIGRALPAALILVLALVCWGLGLRAAARARKGRSGKGLTTSAQVALLANGPIRVAETTVAAMLEREQLRADTTGRIYRTPLVPSDELGREAAELAGAGVSVATVLGGLVRGPALRELVGDLTAQGLLVDGQALRRLWKWVAAGEAVLAAVAVAAFAAGGLNGFVVVSALLPVWCGLAALSRRRAAARIRPTDAGRDLLESAWPDQSLLAGAAGKVTVGGLVNHPDRDLRVALLRGLPATRHTGAAVAGAAGGLAGGGYWAAGAGCGAGCGGSGCGAGCGSGCGGGGCGGGGSS